MPVEVGYLLKKPPHGIPRREKNRIMCRWILA